LTQSHHADAADQRAEALAWLREELAWETRLDRLRRPGRQPRPTTTRPRPLAELRRAG
jgi:hypothetical protein